MSQYFWIAIPAELFFQYCDETMEKHRAQAYIETINRQSGKRNYVKYNKENQAMFLQSFSAVDYYEFYLSTYPFSDQEAIRIFFASGYCSKKSGSISSVTC